MRPKKVISTFIEALNSRIPPPVHTAGIDNARPVPAVVIEDMTIDNQKYHNSNYAGSEFDDQGNVDARVYRHYYDVVLELTVREDDEVEAFDILGILQQALSHIEREPREAVHEHINKIESLGSGGVSYQFYEPTETEINQTVVLSTFYDSKDTDPGVIAEIDTDYDFS